MKIIINDILEFNSDTGVLSKKAGADDNEPGSVSLTRTAARLLQVLLTHHDEILSRDFLMETVWVKYNLKPSNASLNNNITLLRKSLSELGADASMIITHPKMGIELQCHTTVIDVENSESRLPARSHGLRVIILMLCCSIALLMMTMLRIRTPSDDVSHYKFIGKIDRCSVFLIRASRGLDVGYVKKAIAGLKINCKNYSDLYVDADSVGRDRANNIFIFYCKKNGSKKYSSCDNFISYTEKTPL